MPSSPSPRPAVYERRRPEQTVLYPLIEQMLDPFFEHVERHSDNGLPLFVRREFEAFLECGRLENGFLRLQCQDCHEDRWVAFSCKRRGFCASCAGKRMAQSSAHWLDKVIPALPIRQWVLTFPVPLRYLLAAHPELLSPILAIFHRAVASFHRRQIGLRRRDAQTAAISVVQRCGSAANLNIHIHCLIPDGVYETLDQNPTFVPTPPFDTAALQSLLETSIPRILRYLMRQRFIAQEPDDESYLVDEPGNKPLATLQWASCTYRIVFGPNAGKKLFSPSATSTRDPTPLCAEAYGFTLHAATRCEAHQRDALERLCRYITRPPIANERLRLDADGQVVLALKSPYRDGTNEITLSPLEFMGRLAALVPRPWINLIRYHGLFAPNARWRSAIVPQPPSTTVETVDPSQQPSENDAARSTWAELLKRVFKIDVFTCPLCGGSMKWIATITDPFVIRKILDHLESLQPQPPPSPDAVIA